MYAVNDSHASKKGDSGKPLYCYIKGDAQLGSQKA